jgi:hypothetical protein
MIEAKTLLIVGAGASVPYGYPTGYDLKKELFDPRNLVNLQNKIHERGIELFCQHFEESQQKSIDAFLANRGDHRIGNSNGSVCTYVTYAYCGKLAIAHRLIKCENGSLIRTEEDHWLEHLWQLMCDVPEAEFQNNQLKIISFNYDRVIEQYFQTTLKGFYGADYKEASELRKSIEIIHVYGNLQDLDERAYGKKPDDIEKVADCIRVIPEAREANDVEFEKAKKLIGWADKICFIGFGFDPTNLRRLGFPNHDLSGKKIDSTRYRMSDPDVINAQKLVGTQFFNGANHNDTKTLVYLERTCFLSCSATK